MDHTLITTIAMSFLFAFAAGLLAARLGLPPLVGYLLAGVGIGPYTPGFVADLKLAAQLSEIGVILLMFGVGLHFSFRDLMKLRGIAMTGALLQIIAATVMGALFALWWGWSLASSLMLGFSLSVASTVVLLKSLEEHHLLETTQGRIAVGWLVVEDLVMVLALVMIPALAVLMETHDQWWLANDFWISLFEVTVKMVLFIVVMLLAGTRLIPWILHLVVKTDSRELFTLAVIAMALGIAYGAASLFGVSFALGAFLAGVVINGSHISHRAASNALPFQDAFAVLFFVSVGMLFDPAILLKMPWHVLAVVAVIMIGKSIAAFAIMLLFRYPLVAALTVAASLAQIGEFSFILAALGNRLGLLSNEAQSLIMAGAIVSITLNPIAFRMIPLLARTFENRPGLLNNRLPENTESNPQHAEERSAQLNTHLVLVGYGRVGRKIGVQLDQHQIPHVVVENNRQACDALRKEGKSVIFGDASMHGILEHTQLRHAKVLVITSPERFQTRRIIELARKLNPHIDIIVRTHYEEELGYLQSIGINSPVMAEHELADTISKHVLERFTDVRSATPP